MFGPYDDEFGRYADEDDEVYDREYDDMEPGDFESDVEPPEDEYDESEEFRYDRPFTDYYRPTYGPIKPYATLLAEYGGKPIPYRVLLRTVEWQEKRMSILSRDGYRCRQCGYSGTERELHVHHKLYIWGRLPWDYPDDLLETLCKPCHDTTDQTLRARGKV